ncbi:MAG: nickel-dependent hydrogenase large subunit [bacterium]|jgi:coenzyme F420-reducing hydrogenase alpha subunit
MSHKEHIDIDYLARVEGETAIRIELKKGAPIELKIFEPPRFFEGMMVGRKYDEVGDIVSRICGICPVSHMTTAILAIEKAMGIRVSPQTKLMRNVMTLSQIVASHLIHLYMLAMPDYYGCSGVVDMLPQFKGEIDRLLKMKEVMNGLTALIGGRALHPVTHMPGGFTSMPDDVDCRAAIEKLKDILPDAERVIEVVAQFQVPDFHPRSECVALWKKGEYVFNEGRIMSTEGLDIPVEEYARHFKESQVPYAMAKQSVIRRRGSFMVGALARMHLKFDELQDGTKALAGKVGFSTPCDNPYYNNLAQALEVYDGILNCIQLLESHTVKDEKRQVKVKSGEGGAVTEAPRGLLYHWYRIDEKGVVEKANLVTPTSHNFLNIEKDLKQLVDENRQKNRDELRLLCEELVRAYDPCFSCSVH